MKEKTHEVGLFTSIWLYRLLLKLHSPKFRSEWQDQMLLAHEDAYREAWNKRSFYGIFQLWVRELKNVIPDVFQEYLDIKQESNMKEFLAVVAPISSKILMFLVGCFAVVFWLSTKNVFQNPMEQSIWFIFLLDGGVLVSGLLCLMFWKTVAVAIRA